MERITPAGDEELRISIHWLLIHTSANHLHRYLSFAMENRRRGKELDRNSRGMIDDSDVMSLRIDTSQPERIFASACSGIYRSENGACSGLSCRAFPTHHAERKS